MKRKDIADIKKSLLKKTIDFYFTPNPLYSIRQKKQWKRPKHKTVRG